MVTGPADKKSAGTNTTGLDLNQIDAKKSKDIQGHMVDKLLHLDHYPTDNNDHRNDDNNSNSSNNANKNGDEEGDIDNDAEDVKLLENAVDDEEQEQEEEEDDDNDLGAGSGLLQSLTTDIEKYHKKVEEKTKKQDMPITPPIPVEDTKKRPAEDTEVDIDGSSIGGNTYESDDEVKEVEYTDTQISSQSPLKKDSRKKHKTDRKVVDWSKEEDDAIVYYKEEMKYSWKRIEELLDNKHSWQAIQMRYLRNHKSRNEEWSKFMEIKLINAVRKDWENRWKRISVDLGKYFTPDRCLTKNIDICKKIETDYYTHIFKNKDFTTAYLNPLHDIKDPEQHKKLLLVYMGLDSISYEDEPEEGVLGAVQLETEKLPALADDKEPTPVNEETAAAALSNVKVDTIGDSEQVETK